MKTEFGLESPSHECNENASVYEAANGERFYFKDRNEAKTWYDKTHLNIVMGSVACSVCGSVLIDRMHKQELQKIHDDRDGWVHAYSELKEVHESLKEKIANKNNE